MAAESAAVAARGSEWLTVAELAAWLQIPVATLYDWRYKRQGPPGVRVGKHVRYYRDDVLRWKDERLQAELTRPRS